MTSDETVPKFASAYEEICFKWDALKTAFDDMNKKMIENIAAALVEEGVVKTEGVEENNVEVSRAEACKIIVGASRLVILTGAGISLASGLPTYRGKGGIWRVKGITETPQEVATMAYYRKNIADVGGWLYW